MHYGHLQCLQKHMNIKINLWTIGLMVLIMFLLFLIPFSIVSTDVTEYKNETKHNINTLIYKIDSLENELNKRDTIVIKPLKIEIYDSRKPENW